MLVEASDHRLHFFLQLSDCCLLSLDYLVCFKEFIEQHRVDLLVANGFGQPFGITTYQVRIHFGHFLRDQAKGNRLRSIVLLVIAKADRLKLIDGFAGCLHRLNIMFVSARRDVCSAKSAVAVYRNEIWIGANLRLNVGINLADIAAVARVLSTNADSNNVVGRAHATACSSAYSCVETSAGVSRECKDSDCRIVVAGSVGQKCAVTICRVILAVGIIIESVNAGCCVDITGCVASERVHARGGVTEAGSIAAERERTGNRIVVTSGVVAEGRRPVGGVEAASGVVDKRRPSGGCVVATSGVAD